ncbi:hypothetical protein C5Y93_04360 [Blastopirellula marina]|uniref:Uncharacterized protein n=1 Tax=Blastopirellula marina TaxID=124 RepID=A0A2S8GS82_9BACT|nr:hypothetical protein C5Y93_04360 [Blastopirellula marina]
MTYPQTKSFFPQTWQGALRYVQESDCASIFYSVCLRCQLFAGEARSLGKIGTDSLRFETPGGLKPFDVDCSILYCSRRA